MLFSNETTASWSTQLKSHTPYATMTHLTRQKLVY